MEDGKRMMELKPSSVFCLNIFVISSGVLYSAVISTETQWNGEICLEIDFSISLPVENQKALIEKRVFLYYSK